MPRPNVLYIHSHDTGRYIQPYGHAVPTPSLQRLAEEGVLFRQCFCAAPTCSPSRAALLTGQSAHSCGMLGLTHRGFALNDPTKHLARTLRRQGYHTALAGVQHEARDAATLGYETIFTREQGQPQATAGEFLRAAPAQPFFLSVGFAETHRKFPEPENRGTDTSIQQEVARKRPGRIEDSVPLFSCLPPAPLPDTPETRHDMACFKASARLLDDGMGEVFRTLNDTGLSTNTLVICTTDHGIAFPRMKCNLYDGGIGVMLIMRGPGGFEGGRVVDSLVSQIDLFPTLCEPLGFDAPSWLEGVSLMPLIRGERAEVREELFSEVTYHAAYEPQRCVRTKRWKYIRRFGDRRAPTLPNCDDSPSKTLWMQHSWAEQELAREELYDLIFDPNEGNNLAGDPHARTVLEGMQDRLQRWMEATEDPLLKGPVPPPKGARVNRADGTSPQEPAEES